MFTFCVASFRFAWLLFHYYSMNFQPETCRYLVFTHNRRLFKGFMLRTVSIHTASSKTELEVVWKTIACMNTALILMLAAVQGFWTLQHKKSIEF